MLDRCRSVVFLRRLPDIKGNIRRVQRKRRNLAETACGGAEIIVPRIRTAKRKPRVVDPVFLLCAARGRPRCAVAVHIFALVLCRADTEINRIARHDCPRGKADF